MKRLLAWGERMGGIIRAPRLYYAVFPLAIPFVLATVANETAVPASPTQAPHIDYRLLDNPAKAALPPHIVCLRVESGDTLASIFEDGGLSRRESLGLIQTFSQSIDPRSLKLGDIIRFQYGTNDEVEKVSMKVRGWGELSAQRRGETFQVTASESPEWSEERVVSASIDSSLFEAVRSAGEEPQLVQSLVDIFRWDVDFFRLKQGDHLSLLVTRRYVGEDFVGYGPILAAKFQHRGEEFEAYRFESADNTGYFSSNGTPTRKQFLKAPLKFSRITSRFSNARFHPLLKIFRPHHGVDYGAPVGTPVLATADGVVDFAGRDGGEGNFIRLRHTSRMMTSYLHLSRFAKGIKRGARVQQGQVIGYVGSTGLSTGPHLDYRISDGGKWIDPLKMKSITPDPLRADALRRFKATLAHYTTKLSPDNIRISENSKKRPALF